jgi:hypothetical protein
VLSSPVFVYTELRSAYTACPELRGELRSANPHLRPTALSSPGKVPPRPESVSLPLLLGVLCDLRDLCVKNSPPLRPRSPLPSVPSIWNFYLTSPHPIRAFRGPRAEIPLRRFIFNFELSTLDPALQIIVNPALQTAFQRHPLHQNANFRPLFSSGCALFCNYGGGGGSPFVPDFIFPVSSFVFRSSLSPLESALTSQHRVSPRFARNRPPTNPLESASTGFASVNSLESASTKNMGGGGARYRIG